MLDLHRLVLLRELSIRGTMAAVAEALQYSPSAVSQQLTLLEKESNAVLLRKTGRTVQLTPLAEILVKAAEELSNTLERAEAELHAADTSVRGRVRVAVFQSAALALMPAALTMMKTDHPDVRVEMVQKEPEEALHETWSRDFDMVIAEQYPAHAAPWLSGLIRRDLTTDAIRLAVPDTFDGTGIGDAADLPWVMEPRGTASRHFAEQSCRIAGFEPDVRFETADLQAQIRLVESGNAVALMPDLVWAGRPASCTLLTLADEPRRTIFTAQRESGVDWPAARAFLATLEQAAREMEGTLSVER
ncbi:LysR family transcriptional regulator [Herbiconiux sp.]|uniref:LysR family transcriptional regulator n=1 Tax=Herbiconiux sp. TaxID=1871186 RepID=UPI0025C44F7F|nr:LysR family transcriptional regulator [Herbiconiux sp.]